MAPVALRVSTRCRASGLVLCGLGEILCAVGALQVLPLNGRSVCMSEIVY